MAEAAFLASDRKGVMLHSTMIYSGDQENNIRRLLAFMRRSPIVPVPNGGAHTVQPIFVDDLVDCLFSAATRHWDSPRVLPVAGPPLTWRRMATLCAQADGLSRLFVPVHMGPVILALETAKRIGLPLVDPNVVRRFGETLSFATSAMTELGVNPRPFEEGIKLAIEGWSEGTAVRVQ